MGIEHGHHLQKLRPVQIKHKDPLYCLDVSVKDPPYVFAIGLVPQHGWGVNLEPIIPEIDFLEIGQASEDFRDALQINPSQFIFQTLDYCLAVLRLMSSSSFRDSIDISQHLGNHNLARKEWVFFDQGAVVPMHLHASQQSRERKGQRVPAIDRQCVERNELVHSLFPENHYNWLLIIKSRVFEIV